MSDMPLQIPLVADSGRAFALNRLCQDTMNKLKRFQRATVEHINWVFSNTEQHRFLVADEVGLGKTMIARGVIANLAVLRHKEGDDLFKVVYVCSNQTIARQNIRKLRISKDNRVEMGETRLSMQHLLVTEQEKTCKENGTFIQLISLTPGTSFQITGGQGSAPERALMYCILSRRLDNEALRNKLSLFLKCDVNKDKRWEPMCDSYKKRIEKAQNDHYPADLLRDLVYPGSPVLELERQLAESERMPDRRLIANLRMAFAKLSARMLQPDLVIMDEFQRFQTLLNPADNDLGPIVDQFLRCGTEVKNRPRVLLLSATPYKLYSTLDEIDETNSDEHYQEFMAVVDFLLDDNEDRKQQFRSIWKAYSAKLRELKNGILSTDAKQAAEDELYKAGMCRTERISFVKDGDYLKERKECLNVCEGDIRAFIEMSKILEKLGLSEEMPVDFVKSSPFLMSFMDHYQLKQKISDALKGKTVKDAAHGPKRNHIWLRKKWISDYEELSLNRHDPENHPIHAKYECLKQYAFDGHAERLLWIPPSMPYYEPQGVFKTAQDFSKLLVFSGWEMVPRMIATLISYEAERRTNGKLCRSQRKTNSHGTYYFMKKNENRYPLKCLFNAKEKNESDDRLKNEAWFLRVRDPLLERSFLFSGKVRSLEEVKQEVRINIESQLSEKSISPEGYVTQLNGSIQVNQDALDLLTDMAIGAPGICVARALHKLFPQKNTDEACDMITTSLLRMFDSPEGIGAVAEKCQDREVYPRKVLNYCINGNIQAMLDEYCFVLANENVSSADDDRTIGIIQDMFLGALSLRSAPYEVDTWEAFCGDENKKMSMRTHYAVGFNKSTKDTTQADSKKPESRKESVRTAFNSPFRPFVLASTSVGQEGLDFHYYCHRLMHWNLPHNPTDMEQREGRINRYLCHAVRKSLVKYFRNADASPFTSWAHLLKMATEESLRLNPDYSELSPFWCFSGDQPVKIERIVPLYPYSRDEAAYERLLKLLSLYRLTLGQARQEEILNSILENNALADQITKDLFISLCPFHKEN